MTADGSHVQVGCGYAAGADWLNYDASPTLVLERLPIIGPALWRLSRNPERFPAEVRYGNLVKGLPVASASVSGLYASHVLEHLALDDMRLALRECYRVLRPGGVFRLLVPDLRARAERYLSRSAAGDPCASHAFMRSCDLGQERRARGMIGLARAMLGNSRHLWMWDEPAMMGELTRAGFSPLRRARFGDAEDRAFDQVEARDRFVEDGMAAVAIEARRP